MPMLEINKNIMNNRNLRKMRNKKNERINIFFFAKLTNTHASSMN